MCVTEKSNKQHLSQNNVQPNFQSMNRKYSCNGNIETSKVCYQNKYLEMKIH